MMFILIVSAIIYGKDSVRVQSGHLNECRLASVAANLRSSCTLGLSVCL